MQLSVEETTFKNLVINELDLSRLLDLNAL